MPFSRRYVDRPLAVPGVEHGADRLASCARGSSGKALAGLLRDRSARSVRQRSQRPGVELGVAAPPRPRSFASASASSKRSRRDARARRCRTSGPGAGASPRRSARCRCWRRGPRPSASFSPRLRTVSSMPGIETLAPERTETSSGIAGIAERAARAPLERARGPRSICAVEPLRQLRLRAQVCDAGLGGDREAGGHALGAEHAGSSRRGWRPCRRAGRASRASPGRTRRRT